jgi:hypothetical protein
MTSRKKPGIVFWATVVAVSALFAYPLSFGPACWISSRLNAGTQAVTVVYRPVTWCLREDYAATLDSAVRWYAGLGAANEDWGWWGKAACENGEDQ